MLTIAIVQICQRLPKMRVARDLEIGSSKGSHRSQAKRSTGWRDLEKNESYGNQNSDATRKKPVRCPASMKNADAGLVVGQDFPKNRLFSLIAQCDEWIDARGSTGRQP